MSKKSRYTIAYLLFLLAALIVPTINFTICKYKSNAEFSMVFRNDVYDLFYEIRDSDNNIKVTSDKTLKNYRTRYGNEYKGFTLNSVFGADRKTVVYSNAFEFSSTIDSGYKAEIYYLEAQKSKDENGEDIKDEDGNIVYLTNADGEYIYTSHHATSPDFDLVDRSGVAYRPANEGYPLGTEPVYNKNDDDTITIASGPSACNLTFTGYLRDVTTVWKIVVQLIEKPAPIFDATKWTKTVYARNRAAFGSEDGDKYNGGWYPNINPDNSSSWNWDSAEKSTQPMTKNNDRSSKYYGTYTYKFEFQTNSNPDMILDALEINGKPLVLPFVPMETDYSRANPVPASKYVADAAPTEEEGYDLCSMVTYASDGITRYGMKITVTYVRAFTYSGGTIQRVYSVLIEGARTDVVVTGGNIHQYTGAREVIIYNLAGVLNDEVIINSNGGESKAINSDVVVLNDSYETIYNIKFKLADYYENPTVKLTRKDNKTPVEEKIYLDFKLDDDGYYVIEFDKNGGLNKLLPDGLIALLSIRATPIKYAIQYEINNDNAYFLREEEWFDNSYDNNNGRYYTVENVDTMKFHDYIPYDASREYVFSYWKAERGVIGSEDYEEFEIRPAESFRFDRLLHFAKKFDITKDEQRYDENNNPIYIDGVYIITVTAVWEKQIVITDHDSDSLEDAYSEHYKEWSDMSFETWYIECWEKWYSKYWDD